MPKRRTEDVVHAFITDHLIQRRAPNRNLLADLTEVHIPESEEYHGEVIPYYPAEPPPTSENTLYRGAAQVVLQNNLAKGVADLSREINLHPPPRAEFYTTLGDAWGNSGKPDKASAAYEQALRLDGKSLPTLQSLALALQKQGEATKSRQVLDQALQISPKEPNILYQYGLLNAKQGKLGDALSNLQQALSIDPDIPEGYFNLANLLLQMGKAQEAESALVTALSIDPYDAAAYDLKGQVMARKSSVDEALYAFDKAVKLRPGYAPYLYDHALALVQAGRYDAKIKVQAAIKAVPGYAEAHEVLGALYLREKQPALALREYQQAVMLQPELSHAQLNLGLLLYSQGDSVGAIEHLKKAAAGPDPGIASQATQALHQLMAR
jgi:tetratricopeptide (TPR) repeat protein